MTWKNATLAQLYVIAFDDPVASTNDRWSALQEIRRRKKREKMTTPQYKIRPVYTG
jgi:hypothetical protein